MRMLLLEDDERVARGIVRITAMLGCEALATRTIEEAKATLQEQPFDLILADLGLNNGESGLDLLRWASTAYPQVRRVLTSGAMRPPDYAVEPPTQLFLHKPFGRAELAAVLNGTAVPAEPPAPERPRGRT